MTPPFWSWSALLIGAVVSGCGSDGPTLSVDLRTDFIPGTEFDGVAVTVGDSETSSFAVLQEQDFLRGVRVGRFEAEAGSQTVTVELIRAGEVLVERIATAVVAVDSVVQLVISRDCREVLCDVGLSCRGGACVDTRCTASTPEFCPEAECQVAAECSPPVDCATSTCASGVCLLRADNARCGAGACDLMLGCVGASVDGGPMDAPGDAGMDVGTDAPMLDAFSSGALCPERFEPTTTCDVLRQTGCTPGESCLPEGDDATCRSHGETAEGEVCVRGECSVGLRCWRQQVSGVRRCSSICTIPHDCTCGADERCVPLDEAPFGVCTTGASCDPVADTGCDEGQTCYLTSFGPTCAPESGTSPQGMLCDETTECAPGHFCSDVMSMGRRCQRACELSGVVSCICTSVGFSEEYGYCQ
ncbi:MAG: hypothetical protein ACI9KE_000394 [Polyangiales bacterium]|jgi:hypothetical protein